jgi:alpha-tubulin suppressor-like RCC1 family protein
MLDRVGKAACWGWNVDGETGTGTAGVDASMVATPTPVAGDHTFRALSAGAGFTCGLTTASEVLCWGSNVDGVLGESAKDRCGDVGPIPCSMTPVLITRRATAISAGTSHACTISTEGLHCWGSNVAGQLGFYDAKSPIIITPRRVVLEGAVRLGVVASGGIQSCGLTEDGRLFCWGADAKTFGDPANWANDLRPRQVAEEMRFSAVSVGQVHLCALDRAGRVHCWGDTMLGALGAR